MAEFNESPDSTNEFSSAPRRKSGNGMLIATIVLGLLLVGGLAFALYYFLGGRSSIDNEMLAYLPAESNMIFGADLESLQKNAKLKEIFSKSVDSREGDPLKDLNEQLKDTGLTSEDFTKVLVGADPEKGKPTVVFRTRKAFDKAKMAAAMRCKEEKKKGDKTYWAAEYGDRVFFPTDTLIVTTSDKQIDALLDKAGTQVVISDEMQGLCKKMAKGEIWLVVSSKALPPDFTTTIDEAKKGRVPYAPPALLDLIKDGKAAGFNVRVSDDRVKFKAGIVGANKEKAEAAEKEMKTEIKDRKDKKLEDDALVGKEFGKAPDELKKFVADIQKSLDVDREGETLELSWEFSISGLETAVKAMTTFQRQEREAHMQQLELERKKMIERQTQPRPDPAMKEPLPRAIDPAVQERLKEIERIEKGVRPSDKVAEDVPPPAKKGDEKK